MSSQRYPEEFRIEAALQITEHDHTLADVSRGLGVSTHSLYKWLHLHQTPTAVLGQQQPRAEELRHLEADYRKLWLDMRDFGEALSKQRVARLLKHKGVRHRVATADGLSPNQRRHRLR